MGKGSTYDTWVRSCDLNLLLFVKFCLENRAKLSMLKDTI